MNFEDLFELCPTPMLVTNSEGFILESNARTRELAGFKSKKEAYEAHYSEQRCEISAFSQDFIWQDNLVLQSENPFQFLSMYRYSDGRFHVHLGNKNKTKDNQVFTSMFEITTQTSPFLLELLCLYSCKSKTDKERGFTYFLERQTAEQSLFSKRELECIRYLSRSYSSKMIADHMCLSVRTVEGYIDNIKNKLGINSKHDIVGHCLKNRLLSFENLFS